MLIFDETGRAWPLGKEIAAGGEGRVYRMLDSTEYCAKLYHKLPLPALKQDKLKALRSLPAAARQSAAIPVSLGFATSGDPHPHSVILPLVKGHDIYELYNPQGRQAHFRGATFEFLVAAAKNVATAFLTLHGHGIIVGDVNEQNIKVRTDATVSIIDCDSFQFDHAGRLYTSDVGTPLWTPPELQGLSVHGLARTKNHDAFGLAQLVFLLLFAGRYPYAGRPLTNTPLSPEEAIQRHAFAYATAGRTPLLGPPPGAPPFDSIPPKLRNLFIQAFAASSTGPVERPGADAWIEALQDLADNLTLCPGSHFHVHWTRAPSCPWCSVMRAVKVDLFPGIAGRVEENNIGGQENSVLAKRLLDLALHPLELVEPSTFAVTSFIANRPTQKSQPSFISAAKQFLVSIATLFTNRPAHESQPSVLSAAMQLLGFSVTKTTRVNALTLELEKLEERLLQFSNRSGELNLAHRAQCSPLLQKASDVAARLRDIPAMREEALKQLQVKHTDAAMDKFLERFLVRRIKIPGIGEARLAALLSAGITTAADVREEAVKSVVWFGAATAAKLLEWRKQCEAQFKFDASAPLPDPLRSRINELVQTNLAVLVAKGKSIEFEFNQLTAAYSKDFGKLQQEFESAIKERAAVLAELAGLTAP